MTRYTVSATPQAIYPDGQQGSFAIVNNGPWTVLIDDVSSIGAGSFQLPPLASIVWDANRPLWIAAKPPPSQAIAANSAFSGYINATVVVTGNTEPVLTPRGQASILLGNFYHVPAPKNITAYPIETEAFETLTIDYQQILRDTYVNNPPIVDAVVTTIQWYSPEGVLTAIDKFYHPVQSDSAPINQRLNTPIKDSYATIGITAAIGNPSIDFAQEYKVYGQLRTLPESFWYWLDNASASPWPVYPAIAGAGGLFMTSDTAESDEWWNASAPPSLYLSPIKPRLTALLRVTNTTVAGSLILESIIPPGVSNIILETAAIPVIAGTATVRLSTDFIPVGMPLRLRSTAATGSAKLFLVWQD